MNVEKGTTGIYAIINMINGKKYIGKAKDIKARNVQELSALRNNRFNKKKEDKISKHHLQNAWNKYGEENFIFIFLEECSEEKLNEREIYHVKAAGWPDHDLCYNITRGGEGLSGYTHKEETIEKIRIANSGENNYIKKMTPEELEEHLKKQSKSHSGDNNYLAKLTPEEREEHSKKQSERQTGRKMSVESSNKKSKSMKGDNHFTKKNDI
jgi:group I intron endonuclease